MTGAPWPLDAAALLVALGGAAALVWSGWALRRAAATLARERVEAAAQRAALETLLAERTALLDASGEGVYSVDVDGLCVYANPECLRLIGRTAADVLGRNMHALLHHSHADGTPYPAHECPLYRVMRDGHGVSGDDEVFWRADGASFPVQYWSEPVRRDGRIAGAVVYFVDISARQALQAALQRRDAVLQALAYGATRVVHAGEDASAAQWELTVQAVLTHVGEATGVDRIWVVANASNGGGDVGLRVAHCWAQPAWTVADDDAAHHGEHSYQDDGIGVEALRLRRGELLQVRAAELPAVVAARFERLGIRAQLLAPIGTGDAWWGFVAFDDCAGTRAWTDVETEAARTLATLFAAAVQAREGREALRASVEALGSAVQKLQRQGIEIQRQNVQLARASRMKSEFLAAVSHELKTPLNAIIGFAELLESGAEGPLAPRQHAHVVDILAGGQSLLALVGRLIELARLDAGRTPLVPRHTDIGALLRAVVLARRDQARARAIEIQFDTPAIVIEADPALLRRLLDELVDNAVKFSPDGARVELSARRAAAGAIEVAVCDHGAGIAAADLQRLFQPFVQLDAALARQHGGTGIGLALAQRIAELHGGRIAATSVQGQGSCFTLQLPPRPHVEDDADPGESP